MRARGLVLALCSAAGVAAAAQPGSYPGPRTAWGAPDLGGVWTSASYTKLQRPDDFAALVATPAEARAYEAKLKTYHGVAEPPPGADAVGQTGSEFFEAGDGLTRIRGQLRSSWIVDPASGRLPYRPDARQRLGVNTPDALDGPEVRPAFERCVTSTGSAPPLLAGNDANLYEFVETPDHVAILAEKNHETRIVPLNVPRDPNAPPSWSGNSVGRWEGDTLVVETQGFRDAVIDRGPFLYQSGAARIVERFTRLSARELLYQFEVTDPEVFTQTWRGETIFKAAKGPIYEYACHEGNRSIVNILRAARQADGAAPG
jgi:hypothetical protein